MSTGTKLPSEETRLKRFLYLSTESPTFVAGNSDIHGYYKNEKLKVIGELLEADKADVIFSTIRTVNDADHVRARETIFFALASTALHAKSSAHVKHSVRQVTASIIRCYEDLCTFLKYRSLQGKTLGTAASKLIAEYYNKMDAMTLAKQVTVETAYHGWKHKDLMKLIHFKTQCFLVNIVIIYTIFGLEKAESIAEGKEDAKEIIAYLKKVVELNRCENVTRTAELVKEIGTPFHRVPSIHHHSIELWDAILQNLPLGQLIFLLPRLYRLGFLKANTAFQGKVVERLTNLDSIKSSQIDPVEVFIGLRNFEKGGKPVDPKLLLHLEEKANEKAKLDENYKKPKFTIEPPKCPNVINGLLKALSLSFQNPKTTERRYMIGIDISEKMNNQCFGTKNLSCLEAASIMALSLLKSEKDVTIAVFLDNKIGIIPLEKNATIPKIIAKLKAKQSTYSITSAIFDWAANKKKGVDVFLNFMYDHIHMHLIPREFRKKERPIAALHRYRKKMSLPHTKLITFCLASPHLKLADGSPNILDICGFNKEVPKIVKAFSKGLFS